MGDQQPGPIYDNAFKRLTTGHLGDIFAWLGFAGDVVAESEELPAHGQRVDLLARVGDNLLVHVEFFRRVDGNVVARMVEYLARLWQRFPGCRIEQHIVLLGDGELEEEFQRDGLSVRFRVHKLRECDPAELLRRPATAPLAVLAKARPAGRRQLLRVVLETIAKSGDPDTRTLLEVAETLARVHLPVDVIAAVEREARMPFDMLDLPLPPRVEQAYLDGRAEGEARGEARRGAMLLGALLRSRFGDDRRIDRIAGRMADADPQEAIRIASTAPNLDALDI